jgi:EAL domain-containing protein (putative c-di-GMP-specific phosphodiesterase class I)
MTHDGAARVQLENELRLALARRELQVHYQPQVVIADRRITGVEALLRWPHRYRGWVSPVEFIPVAEDSSLILPLGEYALARASHQIEEWDRAGLPPVRLAFNVSRRQLRSAGFARVIEGALRLARLDPGRIELELCERTIVESPDEALVVLKRLKDIGLRIAIDDFGVNHSDPGYLSRMPIDTLKIDGSFVRKVTEAGLEAGVAQAIIVIARARGLRVIAEGVETAAQLAFVASHGCHEAQGELFCRPLPADAVARLLASGAVPGPPVAP